MNDGPPESPAGCLGVFLVVILIMAGCVGIGSAFESYQCRQIGTTANLPTRYVFPTGCFVRDNGRWIPTDHWRVTK